MKTLLTLIASFQEALINNFSDKKNIKEISRVAGVKFAGTLSSDQYESIFSAVDLFRKEWKRYKEDSGKIVIEKNLFVRVISFLFSFKGYFIFRNVQDIGMVTLKFSDNLNNNLQSFEKGYILRGFFIGFIALLVGVIVCSLIVVSIWWSICISLLSSFLVIFIGYKRRKRFLSFLESMKNNPKEIINTNLPFSLAGPYHCNARLKLPEISLIDIANNKYLSWLAKSLQEMSYMKTELKSGYKLGWLWHYDSLENNKDYYFNYHKKDSLCKYPIFGESGYIYYDIEVGSFEKGNLIPVLETDSSFIFLLPPDDLEEYKYSEEDKNKLESLLKDVFFYNKERLFVSTEMD